MLESILIWNFAPFRLSSSLMFLSSALARPVFLTWQKTQWGETGTQETFCCWYLAFSYRFCWITLISSAKGAQLWSRPVEKESPRPAVRLQSPCPSDRDWHWHKTMEHAPNAGSFSQWQSVGRKAMDRFSTRGRQTFYELTCFFRLTPKWYFTVFWYNCWDYTLGIISALFGAQLGTIVSY